MHSQNRCFTDDMCTVTRQPCVCCGPTQPLSPGTPEGSETASIPGDIVAISYETDPKAREANLYKLDSLVVGTPVGKVEISQDEVAALEAEARRALDEGYYCDFCTRLVGREESIGKSDADRGAKVLVVLTPKIVSHWSPQISYQRLEFSESDTEVRRPQFVSAFPAALVPADKELPTSLRFRVIALPSNKTVLTMGVAKWPGFKVYFGKGFGEDENSWGLQWRAEDGAPIDPKGFSGINISKGDIVCITCDTWRGASTISLNGREAGHFCLPCGEAFVLGATLSTGCVLRIEAPDACNPQDAHCA